MRFMNSLHRFRQHLHRRPHRQRPATSRCRPTLEALEDRLVPSTLEVVPAPSPTDATHFHSFQDAYQQAQSGTHDIIQIEPRAVPSNGQLVFIDKANLTIQGDPRFGPAFFNSPRISVDPSATGVTLNNLDLRISVLVLSGNQTTVENSDLLQVWALPSHRSDIIAGNTISEWLHMYGDPAVQANDVVRSNMFTTAVWVWPSDDALLLSEDNGAYVDANTIHMQNGFPDHPFQAVSVLNSQHVDIHNNDIFFSNANTQNTGILVADVDNAGTLGTTSVHIWWNTISTASAGRGLELDKASTAANSLSADVEFNDFRNNGTGVYILGNGTSAGTIDLGGGPLGSSGFNDFSTFTPSGASAGHYAIDLHGTSSTYTVLALDNQWALQPSSTGYPTLIDPTTVIGDGIHGDSLDTGIIEVTAPSSGSYGGGGGGSSGGSAGHHGNALQ
jgi:hypothetical protein